MFLFPTSSSIFVAILIAALHSPSPAFPGYLNIARMSPALSFIDGILQCSVSTEILSSVTGFRHLRILRLSYRAGFLYGHQDHEYTHHAYHASFGTPGGYREMAGLKYSDFTVRVSAPPR
ncbi:hypothetical protein JOM56_007260 [Amanita muscaria]